MVTPRGLQFNRSYTPLAAVSIPPSRTQSKPSSYFMVVMGCKIINTSFSSTPPPPPFLCKTHNKIRSICRTKTISFSSTTTDQIQPCCIVNFKTGGDCKLGISAYPDFDYNAQGRSGTGTGTASNTNGCDILSISFDLETLYIPPLTSSTTKLLGLPLPPFLRIDVVPQILQGQINRKTGQVDLEFMANFWFSVGTIYKAPPLLVKTVLTSEESKGQFRSGKGERINIDDEQGNCRLVGVAIVEPVNDFFDSFLRLPTECLAILNAVISIDE